MKKIALAAGFLLVPFAALAASGFPTVTLTHTSAAVSSTSSITLAANSNRSWLMLFNDHASAVVYCKFDTAAVAGEGLRINAVGGTLVLSARNGSLDTRELRCITTDPGSSETIEITEGE